LLAANVSAQQALYCWNEDGKRVCSDRVPPESVKFDREILNEQGITIRTEEGEITPEERLALEEQARIEAEIRRAEELRLQRDRMLLDTYPTVLAIENLRDRRLEILGGQVRAYEIYVSNLHKKLEDLEKAKQRYAPLSDREDAPPLPENLLLDIERAESQILLYERQLELNRQNQEEIKRSFEEDIIRFRELKNLGA
jgi:hypothetical protein